MLQKIISHKCCYFKLYIHQKNPEKLCIMVSTTALNIKINNTLSDCGTLKTNFAITEIYYILK